MCSHGPPVSSFAITGYLTMPQSQDSVASKHKKRSFLSQPLVSISNSNERSTFVSSRNFKVFSKLMRRRLAPPKQPNNNVLHWLQAECPQDLVPKIIALAGPQTAASLAKTNRYWKAIMDEEETWRVLCEELYKVRNKIRDIAFF